MRDHLRLVLFEFLRFANEQKLSTNDIVLYQCLAMADRAASLRGVALASALPVETARRSLQRLMAQGLVERTASGIRLTEAGRQVGEETYLALWSRLEDRVRGLCAEVAGEPGRCACDDAPAR
jgi:predicted MarR family transcription regulator